MAPTPQRLRLRRRWPWILAAPLLGLTAAETGLRVWYYAKGSPYSRASMEAAAVVLLQPMRGSALDTGAPTDVSEERSAPVPHPYFGWETSAHEQLELEAELEQARANPTSSRRILVVGGSVAAAFCARYGQEFAGLVASLGPGSERPVTLFDHARSGFKQPQQLNVVTFLISLGYRPEVVINVDGLNELVQGVENRENGASEVFPLTYSWEPFGRSMVRDRVVLECTAGMLQSTADALAAYEPIRARGWHASAWIGTYGLWRLRVARRTWQGHFDRLQQYVTKSEGREPWKGPAPAPDEEEALRRSVANWRDSSISLGAVCRAHGVDYVHVLHPSMHDPGSKPLHDKERSSSAASELYKRVAAAGYPRLREEGARLAQHGIRFLDLSMCFQDDSRALYEDGLHFDTLGHGLMAARLAPAVAEILRERAAAQARAR